VLLIASPNRRIRVDHAEVRIDAEAGDEEHVARPVVGVEVAAVVDVSIGRRRKLQ